MEHDEADKLTCIVCRAEGYGIGFKHECSPSLRCEHMTSEVSSLGHGNMQVDARKSPSGELWWCVGCGGLFADMQGARPVATPVWGTTRIVGGQK
jgi:hypothetical protein